MSDTHPSLQTRNVLLAKHVPDHTVRFALVEPTAGSARDDTSRILASASGSATWPQTG